MDVIVEEDEKDREYRIEIGYAHQPPFSSRVVSDGTLRVLALLTILHDPEHRGLVCFEEPENGVHPSRLMTLIQRLREGVTAPTSLDVDEGEPFFQILLNSHSPVVLSCLEEGEAMFADLVSVVNPEVGSVSRKTRIRPVVASNGNLSMSVALRWNGIYTLHGQRPRFLRPEILVESPWRKRQYKIESAALLGAMIKIEFTAAEIKALHYERFHHPHPRVRLKMEVLWLKSQGLPHKEIARLTCIGHTALRGYLQEYLTGGIDKLK